METLGHFAAIRPILPAVNAAIVQRLDGEAASRGEGIMKPFSWMLSGK
jgi:hypothetical protein